MSSKIEFFLSCTITFTLLLLFPLVTFSQHSKTDDIKAFGVKDIEVKSVKSIDKDSFNSKVKCAAKKGEAWTKQAILVGLKFTGEGLQSHTKRIEVETPAERYDSAIITVTDLGYLDDSVVGARYRLWLVQESGGLWTLKRALWAQLCSRPGATFYSVEPCP